MGDDSHLFDSYRCIWLRLLFQHTCVPDSGDVVYVKGSRGMKMETIIEKGFLK